MFFTIFGLKIVSFQQKTMGYPLSSGARGAYLATGGKFAISSKSRIYRRFSYENRLAFDFLSKFRGRFFRRF